MRHHHKLFVSSLAVVAAIAVVSAYTGGMLSATAQDAAEESASDTKPAAEGYKIADGKAAPLKVHDISLDQAHKVIAGAYDKAKEIETKMDIAVVDAGGNLKAFIRMDGAWLGSIDIAIKKAKTSRFFDMPTGEIGKLSKEDGPLYNIEHSNGGLITFPGGIPLHGANGEVIGAIGVSGSTVENDHTVAAAGAAAIE